MQLKHPLILASESPRRLDLLKQAGFDFKTHTREVLEDFPKNLNSVDAALFIAKNKMKVYQDLVKDNIVICADTLVVKSNQIMGKPLSENEAFSMLKTLSGNSHEVITGVVISGPDKTSSFAEVTKVVFENLDDEEIRHYIRNFHPMDKAGSYGIQEWIGLIGIKEITGSYFNVVGLPIHRVYKELKAFAS